jgi:hypothetical protein
MYDVNILVNGSRCKQYNHNGKIFIEAKKDSEYVIEIKNSTWERILAVCSVDGLDILNGKPAVENANGYVINQFGNSKFDGFRVSDEKVAKFVFDNKIVSYASSKEDGAEKNVGVIGVRLFAEKVKPQPIVINRDIHHYHRWPKHPYGWPYGYDWDSPEPSWRPAIWCDSTFSKGSSMGNSVNSYYNSTDVSQTGGLNTSGLNTSGLYNCSAKHMKSADASFQNCSQQMNDVQENPRGFDMGTKWGEAKESKVIEVEFEKGILSFTKNIYYASRQSLIEMGVPIGNEKQVSFPEPFTDKYSTPPKNWKG